MSGMRDFILLCVHVIVTMARLAAPAGNAEIVNQQIMSDFDAARQAVRNPRAGMDWNLLCGGMGSNGWIAVSGEDDPPYYPVNVPIAPYPQFHQRITALASAAPWENRSTTKARCAVGTNSNSV